MASPQSEEGGLLVPQQLVDGINITADTHPTFPLGTEVAVDASFGLSVGHWVAKLLYFAACLGYSQPCCFQ